MCVCVSHDFQVGISEPHSTLRLRATAAYISSMVRVPLRSTYLSKVIVFVHYTLYFSLSKKEIQKIVKTIIHTDGKLPDNRYHHHRSRDAIWLTNLEAREKKNGVSKSNVSPCLLGAFTKLQKTTHTHTHCLLPRNCFSNINARCVVKCNAKQRFPVDICTQLGAAQKKKKSPFR